MLVISKILLVPEGAAFRVKAVVEPELGAIVVPVVMVPVVPETWNLAEDVAEPPITKSSEVVLGANTPEALCQKPDVPEDAPMILPDTVKVPEMVADEAVILLKVGEEVVEISWGVDKVIVPEPLVTVT